MSSDDWFKEKARGVSPVKVRLNNSLERDDSSGSESKDLSSTVKNVSNKESTRLKAENSPLGQDVVRLKLPLLVEDKCNNPLDIMTDLNIPKIKSFPNNLKKFPRVQSYVEYSRLKDATIFNFKFYNICSWMLFSIREDMDGLSQEFTWIIDDESFMGDGINCLKVVLEESKAKIENIATLDFTIPDLIMNKRTYTQSAVPMLLGLNLVYILGINEVHLTDNATNTITCQIKDLTLTNVNFNLLDQRILTCGSSIYAKYDFIPEKPFSENLVCQLSLVEIFNEYIPRLNNIKILDKHLRKSLGFKYNSSKEEFIKQVQIAKRTISILQEESDYNMTIKDWIEQEISMKNRNCRVIMLKSLLNNYLCSEFESRGVQYTVPKFKIYYDLQKDNSFVNKNILTTITRIYKSGLV
jgi:hypothetical protein